MNANVQNNLLTHRKLKNETRIKANINIKNKEDRNKILNKKTWIPFTQGNFVPSLVEIGPLLCAKFGWNWPSGSGDEDFKISSMYFRYLCNYVPFEKGGALHLNKLESPSPKDALCQVWLKLAQWFWRRIWKCEKFTDKRTDGRTDRQTDRQTEDGRQVIRKAHLNSQDQVS